MLISLALVGTARVRSQPRVCSPAKHGASPSSKNNTAAIQAALHECAGGGIVEVEGGVFRTGPLVVAGRNVTLLIDEGASLTTAFPPATWPQSDGQFSDILTFDQCAGCTLTGAGVLNGRGSRPPNGDDW